MKSLQTILRCALILTAGSAIAACDISTMIPDCSRHLTPTSFSMYANSELIGRENLECNKTNSCEAIATVTLKSKTGKSEKHVKTVSKGSWVDRKKDYNDFDFQIHMELPISTFETPKTPSGKYDINLTEFEVVIKNSLSDKVEFSGKGSYLPGNPKHVTGYNPGPNDTCPLNLGYRVSFGSY